MAGYTTVEDYANYYPDGLVESVTIRQTDDPTYPSGWNYSLHLGTVEGDLVVRYDNAHERTKGHERHAPDGTEAFEFPGMFQLLARLAGIPRSTVRGALRLTHFEREVTAHRQGASPDEIRRRFDSL